MKTALKITLAAVVIALTIASCWKRGSETGTPEPVDTTKVTIDTTTTGGDTIVR